MTLHVELNACLPDNPCQNGGTCKKVGESYACSCAAGYAGNNCEMGLYFIRLT